MEYKIKDSGKHKLYKSGMNRDNRDNKIKYSLIPLTMLTRWASHMTEGAKTHGARNWELANSPEDLDRFLDSAFRHLVQWMDGEEDEDHASACWFNVCGAEHVKAKLGKDWQKKLEEFRMDGK